MKKTAILILTLLLATQCNFATGAAELSGNEILKKIDDNNIADNRKVTSTMIVKGRRSTRTMQSQSWIQGMDKAFSEYLTPPREKGTKMLKLGDELWIYSPDTDRTIKIAGHMLRQSMMGSDVSYEDYMEDPKLSNIYDAKLTGNEIIDGRPSYILELTAKEKGLAYHSRKLWVDKERFLPLREDRYAKSGKLLKTYVINEVFLVQNRWYPKRAVFKDALAEGEGTEMIVNSIEFNVKIPDHIFSKASLRR